MMPKNTEFSRYQKIRLQLTLVTAQRSNAMVIRTIVVDDCELMLDALAMMVAAVPTIKIVAKCDDSLACLHLPTETELDLLVTDFIMPGMNGFLLSRKMKQPYPDIKVIVATILDNPFVLEKFRGPKVDSVVSKASLATDLPRAITAFSEVTEPAEAIRMEDTA